MYGLVNVKKFLEDNKGRIDTKKVAAILKRAETYAKGTGIISGGAVGKIFDDARLAVEFRGVVMRDAEHQRIGVAAINQDSLQDDEEK